MSKNQIGLIPSEVFVLMKQLRHLDCSFNELTELPKELEELKVNAMVNIVVFQIKSLSLAATRVDFLVWASHSELLVWLRNTAVTTMEISTSGYG